MATTKKSTTKAAPTTKKATTAKKVTAKKPSTKKANQSVVNQTNFFTVRPTVETVYWLIFGAAILALGLWVLTLTIKINDIYNQIEINQATADTVEIVETRPATTERE